MAAVTVVAVLTTIIMIIAVVVEAVVGEEDELVVVEEEVDAGEITTMHPTVPRLVSNLAVIMSRGIVKTPIAISLT
jgi:hypothetical protein